MKKTYALLAAAVICIGGMSAPTHAKGGGGGRSSGTHGSPHSHSSGSSGGSHSVSGYTKSNGTYVAPSHAKNPNDTKSDNWSTKGNMNPYTGKEGSKPSN